MAEEGGPAVPPEIPAMRASRLLPLSALAALAMLPGCATLSESDCGRGDWFGIGEADALAGHASDRIAQHDEACARYAIAPDPHAYRLGYEQGLLRFCVPPEAFALGRRGGSYHRQCPGASEAVFLPAYDLGRDVYALDQELIRLDLEIDRLRDEIDNEKTSPETRAAAGRELDHVKDERERREWERGERLARAREHGYGDVW
jgi:hypothetical protein